MLGEVDPEDFGHEEGRFKAPACLSECQSALLVCDLAYYPGLYSFAPRVKR